jgi:hypothetical protein
MNVLIDIILPQCTRNSLCVNCGTPAPRGLGFGNVCIKFGTFVCDLCKTSHQAISHRVKSASMSVWTLDEVQGMYLGSLASQHVLCSALLCSHVTTLCSARVPPGWQPQGQRDVAVPCPGSRRAVRQCQKREAQTGRRRGGLQAVRGRLLREGALQGRGSREWQFACQAADASAYSPSPFEASPQHSSVRCPHSHRGGFVARHGPNL